MAAKYKALVDLHYPANPDDDRADWKMRTLRAGQTADDIPERSIGWLERQGLIEPVRRRRTTGGDDGDIRE